MLIPVQDCKGTELWRSAGECVQKGQNAEALISQAKGQSISDGGNETDCAFWGQSVFL